MFAFAASRIVICAPLVRGTFAPVRRLAIVPAFLLKPLKWAFQPSVSKATADVSLEAMQKLQENPVALEEL